MKISHVAFWVNDLEEMKKFYSLYFCATCHKNYLNPLKNFESSFLHFETGATIELMRKTNQQMPSFEGVTTGLHHIAFSVGTKEKVDQLTEQLRGDGFTILGEPRTTGDGYYESVIADPEGNRIEITE